MAATEASLSLKPAKHFWYTAVFVVLTVALLANIAECLMKTSPEIHTAMEGLEYLFFVLGRMLYTAIVGALPLAAALALLFFFDGWISKALVTCILGVWTLPQADILNNTLTRNRNKTGSAIQQPSSIPEVAEQPLAPSPATPKATRRLAKHSQPASR